MGFFIGVTPNVPAVSYSGYRVTTASFWNNIYC